MLIFSLRYAKFIYSFVKNIKKQQKYYLENECEEIDTQNGRNNQQQVRSILYLKFQKDTLVIYCWSAPETHREPTKACFEQFSGKEEQSNGFLGLT